VRWSGERAALHEAPIQGLPRCYITIGPILYGARPNSETFVLASGWGRMAAWVATVAVSTCHNNTDAKTSLLLG
jgi:hypothetical protein